jgi:hypothetical protein
MRKSMNGNGKKDGVFNAKRLMEKGGSRWLQNIVFPDLDDPD